MKRKPKRCEPSEADKMLADLAERDRKWNEFRVSSEPTRARIAQHAEENHIYQTVVRSFVEGAQ